MLIFCPLSSAGVGIGVVDVGYERRLVNHLGAHRTPSILGVINGKVAFFNYALAREHLMQFVEDLLPQRLVEKVSAGLHPAFLAIYYHRGLFSLEMNRGQRYLDGESHFSC